MHYMAHGWAYLVTLVDELVGTRNELKAIDVVELCSHFVPKQPAGTTWRYSPCSNIFRITPYQIAEGALVGDLLSSSDDADLVEGADLRTQAAVDAENLAINDCAEDEEVENLTAGFPHRRVAVLLLALLVKSVDLGDLSRFVISANESHAIRISWTE